MSKEKPMNSGVWFEIPVADLEAGKKFYGSVLDIGFQDMEMGPNPSAIFDIQDARNKPAGHLYPGKPASDGSGATVHLGISGDLEAGLERVRAAGGKVLSAAIEIPQGRFAYCQDPDGNSIALFAV